MIEIRPAASLDDLASVRELFLEYAESLGVDLEYQGFGAEVAGLPGGYTGPAGGLLLATVDGALAGCVAFRRLGEGVCEMKRLFVRSRFRGLGLGRGLALAAIGRAREVGYAEMRLDTLESMVAAQRLYVALGFEETPAYGEGYLPGTRFYSLRLAGSP